jgi:hypothetical protein
VLSGHREQLDPLRCKGFHLHGSLALGGYHHGISDIDLVVLLDHELTPDERELLTAAHAEAGPLLSAAYVLDPTDHEQAHPTWTHGWQGDRRVSLITRAELHQASPREWPEIPDVPGVVAGEVRRAWQRELRSPMTWMKTEYVDLSLTSLARALLTQRTGELASKDEAIAHLPDLGVPARLATAIADRRQGREALPHNGFRRAVSTWLTVRRLLATTRQGVDEVEG